MDTKIKNFRRRFERKFGKAVGLGFSGLQKVSSSLQEVGTFLLGFIFHLNVVFVLVEP